MGESRGTRASPHLAYSRRFSHAVRRRRGHSVPHMRRGQTGAQRPITGAAAREHRQRAAFRPVRVTCAEVDDPQLCMRPAMSPAGAPGRRRARAVQRCRGEEERADRYAKTARVSSSPLKTRLRSLSHPATSRRAPARRRASTHPKCPDGNGTPRTPPAASVGEPRRPGPPARLGQPRRLSHAGSAAGRATPQDPAQARKAAPVG